MQLVGKDIIGVDTRLVLVDMVDIIIMLGLLVIQK
jgi:hypothetical protein